MLPLCAQALEVGLDLEILSVVNAPIIVDLDEVRLLQVLMMHYALHLLDLLIVLHEAVSKLLAQLGQALLLWHLMRDHELALNLREELLVGFI